MSGDEPSTNSGAIDERSASPSSSPSPSSSSSGSSGSRKTRGKTTKKTSTHPLRVPRRLVPDKRRRWRNIDYGGKSK